MKKILISFMIILLFSCNKNDYLNDVVIEIDAPRPGILYNTGIRYCNSCTITTIGNTINVNYDVKSETYETGNLPFNEGMNYIHISIPNGKPGYFTYQEHELFKSDFVNVIRDSAKIVLRN